MEMAYERFGPPNGLRFVETDLPPIGSGDVLMGEQRPTVSAHASLILRGAAYLAALRGDPWRPQA